ncbi:hypothetical protein, partial [Bacteroides caecimuris]|uniref:hypothetical protein n=1 Tax=Bacteroides caecimuris TaxID=1796613 RepID=UPI0026EE33AB
ERFRGLCIRDYTFIKAPARGCVLPGRRGELGNVRGGCRRCGSRGLGWWRGAGSLHRQSGGSREFWRFVSASG